MLLVCSSWFCNIIVDVVHPCCTFTFSGKKNRQLCRRNNWIQGFSNGNLFRLDSKLQLMWCVWNSNVFLRLWNLSYAGFEINLKLTFSWKKTKWNQEKNESSSLHRNQNDSKIIIWVCVKKNKLNLVFFVCTSSELSKLFPRTVHKNYLYIETGTITSFCFRFGLVRVWVRHWRPNIMLLKCTRSHIQLM